MLVHEAFDYALGAKGICEQRQCLQVDKTVPDTDPLLLSRKDPHEQLILNTI
jgi:hypothetical protein